MKDFEIRCDESHLEKNHTLYGKFTLGPFLPGQGTTFGNALRRSLLSELSGLGITAFEILGVMQEFSTLPGLRESVLDLSLNLKQVVLTGILPRSTPPIGFLKVRGPAIIYAADLKLPAGVYCTSPQQYIATLASNGVLNLKFLVSVGKGHSTQPYSLYRSLSKIKLQPTLSPNSVNPSRLEQNRLDDEWKNSLGSVTEIEKRSHMEMENPATNMQSFLELKIASKKNFDKSKPLNWDSSYTKDEKEYGKLESQRFQSSTSYEDPLSSNTNRDDFTTLFGEQGLNVNVNIQKQTFQRVNPHQVLPIDAVFTPVSQVNFLTQINDRFETARENVVLEIWTNGSIHPKRALEEAALSLVQNFDRLLKSIKQASSFYKGLRYSNYLQPQYKKEDGSGSDSLCDTGFHLPRALYNLEIGNLDISLETFILLKQAKIKTLGNLLKIISPKENNLLLNTPNGDKAIHEINQVISQLGINLS